MKKSKNNIIDDWLDEHGDPKITEQVRQEAKQLTMVNNFDIIKPLLNWNSEDEFYFLQILQRKKDAAPGMKVNGTNNNSRLIKAYYIKSLEYFEFIEPEVIELCRIFNARAGLNLNKRSFKKMGLPYLKLIIDNIENGNEDKLYKTYSSIVGKRVHDSEKKWIIDIDKEEMDYVSVIKMALNGCQPDIGSNKVIAEIPSKTGLHLITKPFNKEYFPKVLNELLEIYEITMKLDIQKNNPTNLYIP